MRLIDADRVPNDGFFKGMADVEKAKVLQWFISAPTVDAVKVVRCNNCKYGRPIDKTKAPEKYFRDDAVVCECEDVVGDEPMIYPSSHFCSCSKEK